VNPDAFEELCYDVDVDAGVATITLNRPARRNAWSGTMAVEYRWALHHAHLDRGVRVVVVTGAGGDFCVGADTRKLDDIGSAGGAYTRKRAALPPYPDDTPPEWRHNHCFPLTIGTPVIAAIEGGCAGAGFVLATYADLRWAATDAKVACAFARMGLPAEYGTAWMLARQVGVPNALQLLWSPEVIDGVEAARLGWVQRTAEPGHVLDAALDHARALARGSSPLSLATMKRAVLVDAVGDLGAAYERSVADMDLALQHEDFRRGVAAQRARKRPDFLHD
jgi:enoyl-CoA hydratase/carnithine racemase